MSFLCPECSTPKSLRITFKLELLSDSRSDEIALQIVECSHCGFAGIAVYEESRRGALDSESFDHTGYRVSADDLKILEETIKQCPEPANRRCECSTHRTLGRKNTLGRWNALDGIHLEGAFNMELC
jgi:hypothetical protein